MGLYAVAVLPVAEFEMRPRRTAILSRCAPRLDTKRGVTTVVGWRFVEVCFFNLRAFAGLIR